MLFFLINWNGFSKTVLPWIRNELESWGGQSSAEAHKKEHGEKQVLDKVFYSFDKGIVVNLDESLKEESYGFDFKELEKELAEIHVIQAFEWKDDLMSTLKIERERFKEEMKKVEKMENMKFKFKELDGMSKMFIVTEMDSNTFMWDDTAVMVDSIMQEVNKQLEAAGVKRGVFIQN